MLVNDVCKLTGLTKKAIEYYEKQGLLFPETMENGYRKYEEKEISILREISLLRKVGMSIADIKAVTASDNKLDLISVHKGKLTRQMNMTDAQRKCIDYLLENGFDVENSFDYVSGQLDENRIIKEKLAEAFPENYGLFISFHFGRFLNEKLDSAEKESAYERILEFIDGLADIPFPKEIVDYMTENKALWDEDAIKSIENASIEAINESEGFIQDKRDMIEMYLEYCKSDEYKRSPAYKMKHQLLEFQKKSGYYEVFIENMKILSRDYSGYLQKLHLANDLFLQEYPEAANILGYE